MIENDDILDELKHQLLLEFNCKMDDFTKKENIVTIPKINEGRREYIKGDFFFHMLTLGQNAIISVDKKMHPWISEFVKDKQGHQLFEHYNLMQIEAELAKYKKKLWQTHHMFLPDMKKSEVSFDMSIRWYEQDDIHDFYGKKEYSNAFCEQFDPKRPDTLAVAAMEGERIVGMAGCSADTKKMWQIGIDVLPEYRSRGIGTALVTLLKNEIIERGYIPFYGTSLSNLHSWSIALNSGFYPAWVEIETMEEVN